MCLDDIILRCRYVYEDLPNDKLVMLVFSIGAYLRCRYVYEDLPNDKLVMLVFSIGAYLRADMYMRICPTTS